MNQLTVNSQQSTVRAQGAPVVEDDDLPHSRLRQQSAK